MRKWSRRAFLAEVPGALIAGGAAGGLIESPAASAATTEPAAIGPGGHLSAPPAGPAPAVGVWVPPGWGRYASPALRKAATGSGRATVALVGDSICRGFFASNLDTKGWGGLVARDFQSRWGDGGSGFKSMADSEPWMEGVSALASTATRAHYAKANNLVATTGAWSGMTYNYLGPGEVAIKTADAAATITTTIRGTTAKVIWIDGGAKSYGGFTVAVDGVTRARVAPTGTFRIAATYIEGLSPGRHTVRITANGATHTTETVIVGVAGENGTGCVVNQFSRYGQNTGMVNNGDKLNSGTWNGGWNYPANLFIFALGANDAHASVTGDTWARNVRSWLAGVYDTMWGGDAVGQVDGVLVLPHIGRYDIEEWVYQDYAVRARGIAEAFGLILVDLWSMGRNSWNHWRQQSAGSYWANSGAPGTPGRDVVHLSDVGHQYVADRVIAAVVDNLP